MRRIAMIGAGLLAVTTATGPRAQSLVPAADFEQRLETHIIAAAAESLGVTLRAEAPLRDAARELSWVHAAGVEVEVHEFLRQAQSSRGVFDPFPYVLYGTAPGDEAQVLGDKLVAHLRQLSAHERQLETHVVVAAVERNVRRRWFFTEHQLFVTILLAQRALSFDPLPAVLSPGDRFIFQGEVHAPFRSPEILVTRPDGSVGPVSDLSLDPGTFRVWVTLDRGPGEYQIEVLARDDMGPRVVGLGSLYGRTGRAPTPHERIVAAARSGTLEPALEHRTTRSASRPESVSDAESRMFALVNRDRVSLGLAPLVNDPELAAVARAHSRDMLEHDYFAHVSPRTGRLSERATAAGIRWQRLAENIAVHRDVDAAEAALLRSPGHRVNILDTSFTRIGIGVAFETNGVESPRVFVTQNFMQPAP